jgi:hypothetical protein
MKTNELTGAALDWAVAKCENVVYHGPAWTKFSVDWAQGGPIIEREGITVSRTDQKSYKGQMPWVAYLIEHLFEDEYEHEYQHGPTPLIAAMRCYVASKLGDEVDIPEELK